MGQRRYDDQEVRAIIQRASELQAGLAPEAEVSGMTLQELERVASELGLEPNIVRRAAEEQSTDGRRAPARLKQGLILADCTLEGAIDDDRWESMVADVRSSIGASGEVSKRGNTFEWTANWEVARLTVTATVRGNQTRIKAMANTEGGTLLFWLLGPLVGAVPLLLAVKKLWSTSGSAPALATGLCLAVLAVLGTFLAHRFWQLNLYKKVTGLLDHWIEAQQDLPQTVLSHSSQDLSSEVEPQAISE